MDAAPDSKPAAPIATAPTSLAAIHDASGQLAPASVSTPIPVAAPVSLNSDDSIASRLAAAGLNSSWAPLYLSVQSQTGTPWQILAAVHKVETGQSGTTTRTSSAGATGPMQFMPATFNHYALDGNGDGIKDIYNIDDAMLTAGHYLAVGGANHGAYSTALYNYNHSSSYVSQVLGIAHRLGL